MKLTKFKEKETNKKIILISTGIVLILSLVFVAVSYSLFQKQDEGIVANGTVKRGTSVLKATSYSDNTAFRSSTYKDKIKNITFEDEINIRENKIEEWDISENEDGSIISYVVPNETEGYYDLYIGSINYIEVNPDMSFWFSEFSHLETINGLDLIDTSKVTDMRYMFYDCKSLENLDLSSFNTKNVTTMYSMFSNCKSLENLDLSSFNTKNVTTMYSMFSNCKSLENLDLSSFDTSNVTDMSYMFNMFASSDYTTSKLREIKGLKNFDTSKVTSMKAMFQQCKSLEILDLSSFDTSNVTDMSYMFNMFASSDYTTSKLREIKGLENFDTSKVTSMMGMFQYCKNLSSLDLSSFDTSNVTDMSYMFNMSDGKDTTGIYGQLTEIKGLEHFNTSNVTDMQFMFHGCRELTSLDLRRFDTSKVTTMYAMFISCQKLTILDISNFNVSSLETNEIIFGSLSSSINIKVKDNTIKQWVLNTLDHNLKDSNITIVS